MKRCRKDGTPNRDSNGSCAMNWLKHCKPISWRHWLVLCSTQTKWYTFRLLSGILLRYHLQWCSLLPVIYNLENWYSHKSLVLNVKYIANHVGITQSKHMVLLFCVMILHTILWLYMQSEGTISPYRQNKLLTIITLHHKPLKTNKKIGKPTRDFPI